MNREKATFTVTVNLDMVPGAMHTKESAKEVLQAILDNSIKHYKPAVKDVK